MPTQPPQTDSSATVEHSNADHRTCEIDDKDLKNLSQYCGKNSSFPPAPVIPKSGGSNGSCHVGLISGS